MKTAKPSNGQSLYDLCLQVYGSLDLLVKLAQDNSIENLDEKPPKEISYDENLVVNKSFTGFQYASASDESLGVGDIFPLEFPIPL